MQLRHNRCDSYDADAPHTAHVHHSFVNTNMLMHVKVVLGSKQVMALTNDSILKTHRLQMSISVVSLCNSYLKHVYWHVLHFIDIKKQQTIRHSSLKFANTND